MIGIYISFLNLYFIDWLKMSGGCMNNESGEICGGCWGNHPNPVMAVKSVLFSADSEKPRRTSCLVSLPLFNWPVQ